MASSASRRQSLLESKSIICVRPCRTGSVSAVVTQLLSSFARSHSAMSLKIAAHSPSVSSDVSPTRNPFSTSYLNKNVKSRAIMSASVLPIHLKPVSVSTKTKPSASAMADRNLLLTVDATLHMRAVVKRAQYH